MRAQPAESDAGGPPATSGVTRRLGEHDLAPVGRRADAGDSVHDQANVASVGERGAAAVKPCAETHLDAIRPRPPLDRALHPHGRLEGGRRALEDGEELVAARIDLASLASLHRGADETAHLGEERRVAITEPAQE